MSSEGGLERPKRRCVQMAEEARIALELSREANEDLVEEYCEQFENYVINSVFFITEIQLYINKDDTKPADLPSYKRKYDEMIKELTSLCRKMEKQKLIELRSIYFHPENEPENLTETLLFNHGKRNILDQESVSRVARGFEERDIDYWKSLVGVCKRTHYSETISDFESKFDTIEQFRSKFDAVYMYNRLNNFTRNRVYSKRIQKFKKSKITSTGDKCCFCQDDYKIDEKVVEVPCCNQLYHDNCLKELLKKECKCSLCRDILS